MTITNPRRNAVYFQQPVNPHSSKIYEFFGITPQTLAISPVSSNSSRSRMLPVQQQPAQQQPPQQQPLTPTTISGDDTSRVSCMTSPIVGNGTILPDPNCYIEEGTQTASNNNHQTNLKLSLKQKTRIILKRLIQTCNPMWFSLPTTLAYLSLTLRLIPSILQPSTISLPNFLPTLSTILFLISLVSFSFVSIIFLSRLFSPTHIRLKHRSSPLIERDSVELGFVQYWPAGFALAGVSFGCFAVAEGRVKGRWAMAVYICWWITALWMGITGFFILGAYMSHSTVLVRSKTSPGRGLPLIAVLGGVTGGATVVLAGAVMCLPGSGAFLEKQKIISDGMAAPVVIFCYCGIGGLLLLAVLTYAVVMHELLLVTGWPPPELTGVMFYLVGPLGQSAGALLILGEVVGNGHYLGDLDNRTGGRKTGGLPIATTVSVFFGMLLFGMGGFFLILAIVCLVYRAYRRELEWSCTWNGSVFPLGTLAFSSLWLSYELESGFFRILTLVLVIICFGLFVLLLGFNLKMAVRSRVFRVEDE